MSLDLPSEFVEESRESNAKRKSEATPPSDPDPDAGSGAPRTDLDEAAGSDDDEAAGSDDDEAGRDS
jgi:hypothetical protein